MDAIRGVTMEKLAELESKDSELRTKHGEREGRVLFEQFLHEQGMTVNDLAFVHNAWLERFKADKTGRLETQFSMIVGELARKVHFGDVRDMSADTQEGVTLDTYVQISCAMTKPGANPDEIVRAHGLRDVAQWQKVNAAWTDAMSKDTTFKLTTQYGMLYQKYAGPAFQQQQFEQTAAILADHRAPKDVIDEDPEEKRKKEEELTRPNLLNQLKSRSRNERWKAARWLAQNWSISSSDPNRDECLACVPVLIDVLEHHDDDTISNAEDAARQLVELEQRNDDTRGAMARCMNRAKERLEELEAAFEPIREKATPERITLQSQIQDVTSLIETIEGIFSDWREDHGGSDEAPAAAPASRPQAAAPPSGAPPQAASGSPVEQAKGLFGKVKSLFGKR
jgi:hypothetical protein